MALARGYILGLTLGGGAGVNRKEIEALKNDSNLNSS